VIGVQPVGHVRGGRIDPLDDGWDAEQCAIVLDGTRFGPEALAGLDQFSHLVVVYHFHLVAEDEVHTGARRPRGRSDWPLVGIFAQRGRVRPNRLGVSTCRILGVEGHTVRVQGLDAVDGTPVLDLKPYVASFDARGEVREPAWMTELMAGYWDGPPTT
jgi:tRNA-Thr(GGU) m(6)t(6)A37 methyltransferase TsaA